MADWKAFSPTAWKAFAKKCSELFPFLKKQYNMAQAEWDALTTEEKVALAGQNVVITDDEGTQTFADIIPSDASSTNKLATVSAFNSNDKMTKYAGLNAGSGDEINLNNYTESGRRWNITASAWTTLTNFPTTSGTQYVVWNINADNSTSFLIQFCWVIGTDSIYMRRCHNNAWTSWRKLVTESDLAVVFYSSLADTTTFESGVSASDIYGRSSGKVMQLNINSLDVTTAKSNFNTLCTLPSTCPTPVVTAFFSAIDTTTGTTYMLYIDANRAIHTRTALPANVSLVGTVAYMSS